MGDLGLSIYFLHDNTFKIEGGSVPIIDILKDDYRKNINSWILYFIAPVMHCTHVSRDIVKFFF